MDNDLNCMAPYTHVTHVTSPCILKFCSDVTFTSNFFCQSFSYRYFTNGRNCILSETSWASNYQALVIQDQLDGSTCFSYTI